ncbi:unnamed protein product [Clonostachys byssicola]|uniref:Ribosome maturation protein SDO1/SBDS N-terminal domain-containing protein n=1 Tax=Clonostachys byssicola TaxID=160290 RepID=A0A9N9YC51_9HYPO|nr:unnamed protein product [Clonostachys byssicola]
MTRGGAPKSKIHYKGQHDDFIVFLDDTETYQKWLSDKSIPFVQFISPIQVYCTHKQGAQGTFDAAAKNLLSSEFVKEDGSSYKDSEVEDEAIKVILTKGNLQTSEMPERQGVTNDSKSSMRVH